jgi:taurine dioxygenase
VRHRCEIGAVLEVRRDVGGAVVAAALEVERVGGALGARVHGLKPDELDDGALAQLHQALLDHEVLFLRAPGLTPDQQLAMAARFGEAEVHAFFPNLGPGYEKVSVLDSTATKSASMWHTDESFLPAPPMGTLLHAEVIPPVGGDTCWASSARAYEALSAPMRRYVDGLTAVHSLARIADMSYRHGMKTTADVAAAYADDVASVHPVVRTHPETGQRGLFVNPTYTRFLVGVPEDESNAVIALLVAHQTQERFVVRHHWSEGDLVIWDNRATMHIALNDFVGHRRVHRVSILGVPPV